MSSPLRKKRANAVIWVLMGLLILGLGGFGARNFGGGLRAIGAVGDREIDLRDYARALNREVAVLSQQVGQPISFVQAQALGIDRIVQDQILAQAALDNEAAKMGVSAGDAEVRARIFATPAFQGLDGKFSRETYALALSREGLSEAEYEARLRDDAARTLLQGAVLGATAAPAPAVETLAAWTNETRSFTLAGLSAADLSAPLPDPTAEELGAYYTTHPTDFTRPETRRISYLWLSPEMLLEEVPIDEEALRKAYQDRIAEFVTPERRLVERLVYPDAATAEAARARLDAGAVDFAGLAAERGLALTDIDLGEVTPADLGAAGAAVFALEAPGVIGPLPSDLGPALYAMNAILEAQETTFDAAREDLSAEIAMDRARRLVAERSDAIEDLLASGASLDEVAAQTAMELGEIAFAPGTEDGIAAYPAFREAAAAVTSEDFPTIAALDDGGIFALRLDGIDPPALRPLDEVRTTATEGWRQAETRARLEARAEDLVARIEAGTPLEQSGLVATRYEGFARDGFIEGVSPDLVARVFALSAGETAIIKAPDSLHIVTLTAIQPADPDAEEMTRTRQGLQGQLTQSLSQDMFELYTSAIEAEAGVRLDQGAINAVHAQMN